MRSSFAEPLGLATAFVALVVSLPCARAAEIEWHASSGCDPRERVRAQIEKLLEKSLDSIDTVDFEATVATDGHGAFRLTFVGVERGRAERRSRTIAAPTCAELADASAVAMTLAIRATEYVPDASAAPAPVADIVPTPTPGSEASSPAPPRDAAPVPARRERQPAPFRPVLGAHGALDTAALPGVSAGAGLLLGVSWRSLRAEAGFVALLPRTREAPAGGGGEFSLALGSLGACLQPPDLIARPLACVAFELGELTGEGVGVARTRSGSSTWTAMRIEGGAALEMSPGFSLIARAGAARPFSRPSFVLGGEEVVFRPSALTVRGSLGVEYSW